MEVKYHIFIPEYVPLENKGEEAIVRGMGDVIFPQDEVEFHLLDFYSKEYRCVDGIHVYPYRWFYSPWRGREFIPHLSIDALYSSGCAVLRHAFNRLVPTWVTVRPLPLKRTSKVFRELQSGKPPSNARAKGLQTLMNADFVIAGHDGAFNEYDCHAIKTMLETGLSYGIFGSTMKPSETRKVVLDFFGEVLVQAKFVFCRNKTATDWTNLHFPNVKAKLCPDPAFGMRPASEDEVTRFINQEGLTSFFAKPVVMVTAAVSGFTRRSAFKEYHSLKSKLACHSELLSHLVGYILEHYDVNILFLPHSVGPTKMLDDRWVANEILSLREFPSMRVKVLETECAARLLKGLIGRAELLVGERVHSMIAAVGMHTPFMCLGPESDYRIRGIICEMCECQDVVYHLDSPDAESLCLHFDTVWQNRSQLRSRLRQVSSNIQQSLAEAGSIIRATIQQSKTQRICGGCQAQ